MDTCDLTIWAHRCLYTITSAMNPQEYEYRRQDKSRDDGFAVIGSVANHSRSLEDSFDFQLQLVQSEEDMVRLFGTGRGTINLTSRVLELESVLKVPPHRSH